MFAHIRVWERGKKWGEKRKRNLACVSQPETLQMEDGKDVCICSDVRTGEVERRTKSCMHPSRRRGRVCVGCRHGQVCVSSSVQERGRNNMWRVRVFTLCSYFLSFREQTLLSADSPIVESSLLFNYIHARTHIDTQTYTSIWDFSTQVASRAPDKY